jgi:hypothetical protein
MTRERSTATQLAICAISKTSSAAWLRFGAIALIFCVETIAYLQDRDSIIKLTLLV